MSSDLIAIIYQKIKNFYDPVSNKAFDSKNNDLVYHRQKLQKALEDRQAELFEGLLNEKVQRAIEALVLDEDYDIVIPRQAALYVGDLYDVTRKVTERLNEMDES